MGILHGLKTFFLDLLFPVGCSGCGRESPYLCQECCAAVPRVLPSCIVCGKLVPDRGSVPAGRTCVSCRLHSSIYAFFSPYRYETPEIRELIHDLKYQRVRPIAELLGKLLADSLRSQGIQLPEDAFLLSIPMRPGRERVRGFNQSLLLAKSLERGFGIPVLERALIKTRRTKPQTRLSGGGRRTNIAGSLAVRDSEAIKGHTVVLVDDVKTTGATLEEAARVLKEAGAKQIWAITIAH